MVPFPQLQSHPGNTITLIQLWGNWLGKMPLWPLWSDSLSQGLCLLVIVDQASNKIVPSSNCVENWLGKTSLYRPTPPLVFFCLCWSLFLSLSVCRSIDFFKSISFSLCQSLLVSCGLCLSLWVYVGLSQSLSISVGLCRSVGLCLSLSLS
jgi:hypothetical protein